MINFLISAIFFGAIYYWFERRFTEIKNQLDETEKRLKDIHDLAWRNNIQLMKMDSEFNKENQS